MVCPSCGAALEGRFCTQCGVDTQPFSYLCPVCATAFSGWRCPTCGTPVYPAVVPEPPGAGIRAAISVVWSIAVLVVLGLMVVHLVVLAYTSWLVVEGAIAGGPRFIDLYVLAPFPTGVQVDAGVPTFLAYFALLVVAIVAGYVLYTVRDARTTGKAFGRPVRELRARLESKSAWVAVAQVFLAVTFFQFAYILLLAGFGVSAEAPPFPGTLPEWYPYYSLVNASVYEEFAARWMLIGLPLAVAAFALRGSLTRAGRTDVPAWRHLLGGTVDRETHKPLAIAAAVLVALSATIFGLAHVPAWGWWKFLPSAVAGVGMGYLFLRHGFLAGVLFHFGNNYLGALALLTESSLVAQALLGLLLLVLIGFGSLFFVWYVRYGTEIARHFAVAWGLRPPAPVAATAAGFATPVAPPPWTPPPPPGVAPYAPPPRVSPAAPSVPSYGTGFLAYRCPRCGWPEARYDAGRLTCLRCGHAPP